MKLSRRRLLRVATGAVALPGFWSSARAQAYPARPVRVIVPFGPGGPTDVFARLIAQKLSEQLGTQFYVENIGGAGGNIGAGRAAQAAPDGYTILVDGANLVLNPALYPHVSYDPAKDFDPITIAVSAPAILTVHPTVAAQTVKELVELIRANPGKYSFASPGTGTPPHLVGELFRLSLNLDLVHVPFNGGAPAVASIVAGHTPIGVSTLASAAPYISEGKLRALAITSKTRSRISPQVPTMTEAGYPQIEGDSWIGVLVPAGTQEDIVGLLNRAITGIITSPKNEERLTTLGYDPVASTADEFAARISAEIDMWGKVIPAANIKPQ